MLIPIVLLGKHDNLFMKIETKQKQKNYGHIRIY